MLIASADNPQKPVVNLGSTVWSTIPAPQGQPSGVAVEADADIPDLKMHASMILRKNGDPTLQATHTIDLKFTFQDGAPFTGFKDVGLPQMRKLDSTASEALNSVKVKISDDYFLFALAKGDQDSARNLDLIQTRAWFDFPLLLNDNRIAKLVFQKSSEGEAMLQKRRWTPGSERSMPEVEHAGRNEITALDNAEGDGRAEAGAHAGPSKACAPRTSSDCPRLKDRSAAAVDRKRGKFEETGLKRKHGPRHQFGIVRKSVERNALVGRKGPDPRAPQFNDVTVAAERPAKVAAMART